MAFFPVGGGRVGSKLFGVASAAKFRGSAQPVWFLKFCFPVKFLIYCFCQQGEVIGGEKLRC